MIPKLPVLVKGGRLQWPENSLEYIRSRRDGWYVATIRRPESRRSIQQNKYYWGVVIVMVRDAINEAYGKDYDSEQVHELMKALHGIKEIIGRTETVVSTTRYTVEQFMDYTERVKAWAAEVLEIYVPDPNEVEYEEVLA